MTDWCLYGEATDIDGAYYSMAPDIVIVDVPKDMVLTRRRLFRFLRKQVRLGKKELQFLKKKELARNYWGIGELYTWWVKLLTSRLGWLGFYRECFKDRLTLIPLRGELPADLRKGFSTFGNGFTVRFYDWAGCNDEDQLKKEFSVRHPGLMEECQQVLNEVYDVHGVQPNKVMTKVSR